MAETLLTADDITTLNHVGELMCDDMIGAAAAADVMEAMGMDTLVDPDLRVTHEMTSQWVAIAEEYAEALDALEAGTF
jgi:hypothetical protein